MMNLFTSWFLDPATRKPSLSTCPDGFTVVNQPNVKAVEAVALCTKMAEFDAKKFRVPRKGKEGGCPKEEKKVAEKKPEKKEEAPEDDGSSMPVKKKDPLDELPAGKSTWRNGRDFISTIR